MKKQFFTLVSVVVAVFPFVLSCNKTSGGDDPAVEVVMPEPATKKVAKTIEFKSGDLPKFSDSKADYEVISIEFTEGSRYILKRRVVSVKSKEGDIEIIVGTFSENNGTYNLTGIGTVTVSSDNKEVGWNPSGEENEDNQTTTQPTVKNTTTGNTDQGNIARTWKVDNCLLSVNGNGVSIEKSFNGMNLQEMAKYAADNGVSRLKGKEDRFNGYNVANIIFTGSNTFCVSFTGANGVEGSYNLNVSAKKFSYNFSDSDNEFFHGSGSGEYSFPSANKANVSMSISLEGYNGTITMALSQAN